jgi:hypothetical protein
MVARNESQFALLKRAAKSQNLEIERFVFKGNLTTPLNWVLNQSEQESISAAVQEIFPSQQPATNTPGMKSTPTARSARAVTNDTNFNQNLSRNQSEWTRFLGKLRTP